MLLWKKKKKIEEEGSRRPSTKPRPKPNAQKKIKEEEIKELIKPIPKKKNIIPVVGCCLALTTDFRLYSSHCRQCCLGPVPAEWDPCCCRCSVELAEGSICQVMSLELHSKYTRCLDTWRCSSKGCAIALAGGDVTPCMFDVITLAGHDAARHPTGWSTTTRPCGTSLDLHAIGLVTLLTRAVSLK